MRRLGLHAAAAVMVLLLISLRAGGQTTQSASGADAIGQNDQATEASPLRISESESKAVSTRSGAMSPAGSNYSDLSRIAVALLIVIGIILVLRAVFRQMTVMGAAGGGRNAKLVTVLSRSAVSPRQQVLVLQVGKRLVVVGDSGGRMNSLCEITDPDEIAVMLGQTRAARETGAERNPASFMNLFRRANEPFNETETEALAISRDDTPVKTINPDEAVSSEEMNGLMDKVRMLQEQFRLKA